MTIWKNCTADIYYSDDAPDLRDPGYEVRLEGDELVISYQSDGSWINYKGVDQGGGHFLLTADSIQGRAMLHRAPDAEILEGCWSENSSSGMWRVYLKS
ncbi:MAG: hypothetical protein E6R09_18780 [Rhodocyclaceae bacterium]|nr:MAG: hypothetical protein E6R09_18780 [Rhodocyclaceae bacterium]